MHTGYDLSREMPFQSVTANGMTAAISVRGGFAVVDENVFSFWVSAGGAAVYSTCSYDLFHWNFENDVTCTKIELIDDDCLGVHFHNKRTGKWAGIEYRASPEKRLRIGEKVRLLQARMRAVLKLQRKKDLALAMSVHPRLGENSPITPDILTCVIPFMRQIQLD